MEHSTLFILLACLFGFLMTWGVGANDLANVMSTSLGSKAITVRQAIIIAILFEFAGAIFGGGHVTATIRSGIIDTNSLTSSPEILIYGMLAVLLTGTTWMTLASFLGLPVSITHTIIGSIVGFGWIMLGPQAIHWDTVTLIAITWIISPLMAGVAAYVLFMSVQVLIFRTKDPVKQAKRYVPFYMFLVGLLLAFDTVLRGLHHFNLALTHNANVTISLLIAFMIMIFGMVAINRMEPKNIHKRSSQFFYVEKMFGLLMFFTACAMVFAHGSNDVANAVGPIAVVVTIVRNAGSTVQTGPLPIWIILFGCTGIVIGLLMYGRKVITTVGSGITALTPSRAFAATMAAAATVIFATSNGIPVSATQTLVGGVFGVGLARGIGALNTNVIRNIFMSWIITLPVGALLTIIYFNVFKGIF